MSVTFTHAHWAALRDHAYRALESLDRKMPGWARWLYPPNGDWGADDLNDLERMGLIEIRREYMDNWVRPTETGWQLLRGAGEVDPADEERHKDG